MLMLFSIKVIFISIETFWHKFGVKCLVLYSVQTNDIEDKLYLCPSQNSKYLLNLILDLTLCCLPYSLNVGLPFRILAPKFYTTRNIIMTN